jgi:hypothetical protein
VNCTVGSPVIVRQPERSLAVGHNLVTARDFHLLITGLLIDPGPDMPHLRAGLGLDHQIAGFVVDAHRAVECQANLVGIASRLDDEIIFEIVPMAVEDQVDPVVDVLYLHAAVLRDTGVPVFGVFSNHVVADATRRLQTLYIVPGVTAAQIHSHQCEPGSARSRCCRPSGYRRDGLRGRNRHGFGQDDGSA